MSVSYSKNLSEQIGKLRKLSGMTQDQLAVRLGVSYQGKRFETLENGWIPTDEPEIPAAAERQPLLY